MNLPLIQKLSEVNYESLKQVGGKAASLGEMMQLGMPVPPGYVITIEAFQAGMSEDLKKDILAAYDLLGAPRVAVRSSAVAEDSKSASWAGQLESYLNTTRDELIGAVENCWASMKSDHAVEYAIEHKVSDEQKAVAVVVQAMVDSDLSGVLFTANPVTRNRDEILVEAAHGLGELLVQGEITPESIAVRRDGSVISRKASRQHTQLIYADGANKQVAISKPGQIVDDRLLQHLVQTAIEIERYYGAPQDIEWAVEGGKLYIVQSRPITTLESLDPKPAVEPRFELLSPDYRVTPFVISRLAYIMSVCVERHIPNPPECILEFVGGNVNWYAEIPKWDVAAQGVVTRLLQDPDSFRGFNRILALDIDKLKALSRRLYLQPLDDLSNHELSKLHKAAMELYEKVYARGIIPTYTDLGTPYLSNELKAALSAYTSEVDKVFVLMTTPAVLSELAQEEMACLQLAADSSIKQDSPAVIDHQHQYYWLTYGYEGPAYSVADIWRRVVGYRSESGNAARRLEELAHHEQNTSAVIDDTVDQLCLPHRLQMSLAIAREWVSQKAARKEAFFATYAAFDRIAGELARRMRRAKSEIKFLSYSETQTAFGNGTLPPDLADRAQRCVFVYREKAEQVFVGATANAFLQNEIRQRELVLDASFIKGQVAYVGRISGVARIIREPADMSKMRPGNILVSPATNPNLLPAMHQAAAFVTDVGGITCHAAIVAREMKKPCIVGTKIATQILQDGDFVEVDANQGIVRIME